MNPEKEIRIKTAVEVAGLIDRAIVELGKEGKRAESLIEAKAVALSDYDRLMGVAVGTLKAEGVQTTLVGQIAKERTYKALYAKVVAEESLKAHYSRIGQLESILNGYQSLFRHLQSITLQENR